MKGINFQCLYDIEETRYPYAAVNNNGEVCGFINPPVRNFELLQWVDSVTGEPGEPFPFERWDVSARVLAEVADARRPQDRGKRKPKPATIYGKKFQTFKRDGTIAS